MQGHIGQHILDIALQLARAQGPAGKLDAGFIELVGLVQHHDAGRGQQLRHAGVAHLHVGKEQVVVDHAHIGGQGLGACGVDVALLPVRAGAAHAVVLGRGHHGRDGGVFHPARQLGQIAAAGAVRPVLHPRHGAQHLRVQRHPALVHLAQAVQAQVAGAPLEPRHPQGQAQGLDQARHIAQEQLVLQRLGGRGNEHPLAAEQGWHQVGESLADAGARLDHQHAAVFHGARHGQGHGRLAGAWAKVRLCTRQPAILDKGGGHLVVQVQGQQGVFNKK